jgi:hypothetical protein
MAADAGGDIKLEPNVVLVALEAVATVAGAEDAASPPLFSGVLAPTTEIGDVPRATLAADTLGVVHRSAPFCEPAGACLGGAVEPAAPAWLSAEAALDELDEAAEAGVGERW